MDKNELKAKALLEEIANLQNKVADLRVELTMMSSNHQEEVSILRARINELETTENEDVEKEEDPGAV